MKNIHRLVSYWKAGLFLLNFAMPKQQRYSDYLETLKSWMMISSPSTKCHGGKEGNLPIYWQRNWTSSTPGKCLAFSGIWMLKVWEVDSIKLRIMLINMILMRKSWIFWDNLPPESRTDMVWVSGAFHRSMLTAMQLWNKRTVSLAPAVFCPSRNPIIQ